MEIRAAAGARAPRARAPAAAGRPGAGRTRRMRRAPTAPARPRMAARPGRGAAAAGIRRGRLAPRPRQGRPAARRVRRAARRLIPRSRARLRQALRQLRVPHRASWYSARSPSTSSPPPRLRPCAPCMYATICASALPPISSVSERRADKSCRPALLRSAECAGVRAVVLARDRTVGLTPAAIKSSAGAWVHLKIARCGNVARALEDLKEAGYWVAALAPDGPVELYDLDTTRRLVLVVGSEEHGVRGIVRKTADFVVRIPMRGRIESLNVSVAAAVALFEVARRRAAATPRAAEAADVAQSGEGTC